MSKKTVQQTQPTLAKKRYSVCYINAERTYCLRSSASRQLIYSASYSWQYLPVTDRIKGCWLDMWGMHLSPIVGKKLFKMFKEAVCKTGPRSQFKMMTMKNSRGSRLKHLYQHPKHPLQKDFWHEFSAPETAPGEQKHAVWCWTSRWDPFKTGWKSSILILFLMYGMVKYNAETCITKWG